MTWFFAILLVVLMAAVAVVAAGHGRAMAEVYDDRPDSLVPVDGPLTGTDIRRVRFSTAFRGYRMSEVDALLDRLATQLDHGPPSAPPGSAGDPEHRHLGAPPADGRTQP